MKKARREYELEEARRHKEAAREASEVLKRSVEATADHPYLKKKGLGFAFGLRLLDGKLVMPLHDEFGAVHSIQYIDSDSGKLFLKGGRKKALFYKIGEIDPDGDVFIGEGFATMASVQEATGKPAIVALDCGNLKPVAEALRRKYRAARFIFCADHDAWTRTNPGESKAIEAAASVNGTVAVPVFAGLRANGETDFNDLHVAEGLDAVRRCIDAATGAEAPRSRLRNFDHTTRRMTGYTGTRRPRTALSSSV